MICLGADGIHQLGEVVLANHCIGIPVRYMLELLKRDIKPRDIMTFKAFENAIVLTMALGGSTNAVLHLIAMAK